MYDEEENEEMGNSSPSPFDRHGRGMRPMPDDGEESPLQQGATLPRATTILGRR